jgi:hypothetical protein
MYSLIYLSIPVQLYEVIKVDYLYDFLSMVRGLKQCEISVICRLLSMLESKECRGELSETTEGVGITQILGILLKNNNKKILKRWKYRSRKRIQKALYTPARNAIW